MRPSTSDSDVPDVPVASRRVPERPGAVPVRRDDHQEAENRPGSRHRFLVALVVPGRPAAEVDGLRRALRPELVGRVPPHVTLVPPVNVRDGDTEEVLSLLRRAAAASHAIAVELGPAATFLPRSPVMYLRVTGDVEELGALRHRLASGPLAPPPGRAEREFVPHVTLTNQVARPAVATLIEVLSGFRLPATFTRLSLLEQDVAAPGHPWHEVADVALGAPAVVGRGGFAVELSLSERLDPATARWASEAWAADARDTYGPGWVPEIPFAVVARHDGELLGVATGEVRGSSCELQRLIVAGAHRHAGVGGHLLRFVERLAGERGCDRVRLRTIAGGPAEGFYARRGFSRVALLSGWREGRDFVVMERALPRRE